MACDLHWLGIQRNFPFPQVLPIHTCTYSLVKLMKQVETMLPSAWRLPRTAQSKLELCTCTCRTDLHYPTHTQLTNNLPSQNSFGVSMRNILEIKHACMHACMGVCTTMPCTMHFAVSSSLTKSECKRSLGMAVAGLFKQHEAFFHNS